MDNEMDKAAVILRMETSTMANGGMICFTVKECFRGSSIKTATRTAGVSIGDSGKMAFDTVSASAGIPTGHLLLADGKMECSLRTLSEFKY